MGVGDPALNKQIFKKNKQAGYFMKANKKLILKNVLLQLSITKQATYFMKANEKLILKNLLLHLSISKQATYIMKAKKSLFLNIFYFNYRYPSASLAYILSTFHIQATI
jgi:hypothetical protein